MITISTREQLAKMVDKHRNLTIDDDDVLIEFSLTTLDDVRNITARNITARNITARNITARNISAGDITAWNISAGDISAGNISARNITAGDISAGNISYNAFFCCYGRIIKHGKIEARHPKAHLPIELGKEQEEK